MVTLVKELPYAAVVSDDRMATVCSNCFTTSEWAPFNRCAACKVVRYCCTTCQKADWKDHKMECQFLKRFAQQKSFLVCPGSNVRLVARILMKIHCGDLGKSFNGRTINDLMDHVDDIKRDPVSALEHHAALSLLRMFMDGQELPSDDELLSIFGKILCNEFQIRDEQQCLIGTGLYLGLSVHDHSCEADALMSFDGATMELQAKVGVKYSEQISISYVNFYQTNAERSKELRRQYFFECSCPWCRDPDHEGSAMSVRSPCCPDSACLLREDTTELACNKCGKINKEITVAEARAMNEELQTKIEGIKNCDMRKGMRGFAAYLRSQDEIYKRFAKVFSPWNMNLATVGLEVARMAYDNGETSIAEKYATANLAAYRKYLGPGHLDLPAHYINAADMMGLDKKEAQDLVKEGHALALSTYGPYGRWTKIATDQLQKIAQLSKAKGKGKRH